MKFSCNSGALQSGLQTVTKALSGRTTNPVLEGILIQTNEDGILLTCSDERITIRSQIEATVSEHGQGVVPGKLFNEIIRRLSDGEVKVDMNERFIFRISCGNSRTNMAGQDADLFPRLPMLNNAREVSLPQRMLKEMIQNTEFAIATEDMREALTGGYLEIKDGSINMVALDGFRLAMSHTPSSDQLTDNFSAIIPGRALSEIARLLSDSEEDFVKLSLDGNKLHFALDTTDIYVILIAGDYIDYRRIIPKQFGTYIELDLEPFRRCVDRAALIARAGTNNLLLLRFESGKLSLEAHSQIGDVHEELEVEQNGADLSIAFNVRYLTDVVRYMNADRMKICLNDPVHPCVIEPADGGNVLYLVLPVRTSATN